MIGPSFHNLKDSMILPLTGIKCVLKHHLALSLATVTLSNQHLSGRKLPGLGFILLLMTMWFKKKIQNLR